MITYCYKVCKKYIIQAASRIKKVNNKSDRKQEFKREVYNFLVAEKEGVRTTEFNIEELKTYLLSQDSTFTQVFIVINKSYFIFCPQEEVTYWIGILNEVFMHDEQGTVYILM